MTAATHAARRDASYGWGHGDAGKYHLPRGETFAACSSRIILDDHSWLPVDQVPQILRCQKAGCRNRWT